MAIIIPFPPRIQGNRLFFTLPAADQRKRVRVLVVEQRLSPPTVASMCGMQVSEVERIVAEAR